MEVVLPYFCLIVAGTEGSNSIRVIEIITHKSIYCQLTRILINLRHGGQMGRSRMKSDETTKSAGYAAELLRAANNVTGRMVNVTSI